MTAGVGSRVSLGASPDARLSRRQYQCLQLMGIGYDRNEVAEILGLTMTTVREHLRLGYRKLGVASAIQAFRVLGWLEVPGEENEA